MHQPTPSLPNSDLSPLSLALARTCRSCHPRGGPCHLPRLATDDSAMANEFCDIVIPSGMGLSRDFLNALSADGVIVVGGGSGTLSEICAAYMYKKPIATLKNSGGMATKYSDQFIDHRENVKIVGFETPKDAVNYILEQTKS